MLGLVRRKELEKAEAETRVVLAHLAESVARHQETMALLQAAQAGHNEWAVIADNWQKLYAAKDAELKRSREELSIAHWTLRIPGWENGCPHALMGDYVEGGH